jgi:UDP-N-acetylmuramoyl-L-alanyl-D-glutamate--2,6-diaminopimelate ligase
VLRRHARGVEIRIESAFGAGLLDLPLVGDFNVENALTALAVLLASGVRVEAATGALGRSSAPPGRMEAFGGGAAPLAIVDFAHTPDALTQALAAARGHGTGRLWVVFGCGGDRDRGKRPLMGRAAAAAADELVLTDDNPRSEDPAEILADIVRGLPPATRYQIIPERAAAIRAALAAAAPGDVVLVAGKGHEDTQIHGAVRRPFSDRDTVRAALAERRA